MSAITTTAHDTATFSFGLAGPAGTPYGDDARDIFVSSVLAVFVRHGLKLWFHGTGTGLYHADNGEVYEEPSFTVVCSLPDGPARGVVFADLVNIVCLSWHQECFACTHKGATMLVRS